MKLLVATHNPGKFTGICGILKILPMELVSLADVGIFEEYPEEASTFESNALGKARFYHELSGLPTVADDSGIFVEALGDELGVKTRRWGAGEQASDEEWLNFFMRRMEAECHRAARFVCVAAYADDAQAVAFEGETQGEITREAEAPIQAGIPLSSVFKPKGCAIVYSALSPAEKVQHSHRGKAFSQLLHFLQNA